MVISRERELIEKYAYLSMTSGKYVYSIDDSRFINHSSKDNNVDIVSIPGEPETCGMTNRVIEAGEELLINYREFDIHDSQGGDSYLDL